MEPLKKRHQKSYPYANYNHAQKCHVPGCETNLKPRALRNVQIYSFPTIKERCALWKKLCGINEDCQIKDTSLNICANHFPVEDFHTIRCKLMNLTENCSCRRLCDPCFNLPGPKSKPRSWVIKKQELDRKLENKIMVEELLKTDTSTPAVIPSFERFKSTSVNNEPYEIMQSGFEKDLEVFSGSEDDTQFEQPDVQSHDEEWAGPVLEEPAFSFADLCRICAKGEGEMVPIFEEEGINLQLQHKINTYLPVKVHAEDTLPLIICRRCIKRLEETYQLSTSCQQADITLRFLLIKQNIFFQDIKLEPQEIDINPAVQEGGFKLHDIAPVNILPTLPKLTSVNVLPTRPKPKLAPVNILPTPKLAPVYILPKPEITPVDFLLKPEFTSVNYICNNKIETANLCPNYENGTLQDASNASNLLPVTETTHKKIRSARPKILRKKQSKLKTNLYFNGPVNCIQNSRKSLKQNPNISSTSSIFDDCDECNENFLFFTPYINHMLSKHSVFSCVDHRATNFSSIKQIDEHRKSGGCKTCMCSICGETFTKLYDFIQHFLTSHGGTKLCCKICGKFCSAKSKIILIHQERHECEREMNCIFCSEKFKFKQLETLISHLKICLS